MDGEDHSEGYYKMEDVFRQNPRVEDHEIARVRFAAQLHFKRVSDRTFRVLKDT